MPPVAVASALQRETFSVTDQPALPTPIARIQAVLHEAHASGQTPVIDQQTASDAEVLVERLRKLRARGGKFAELALGPALAELHVRARLAG